MKKLIVLSVLVCALMTYLWVQLMGIENYLLLTTSGLYVNTVIHRRLGITSPLVTIGNYLLARGRV